MTANVSIPRAGRVTAIKKRAEELAASAAAPPADPPPEQPVGQHKIYVSYVVPVKSGKRHEFGAMILNSAFPDIDTEERVKAAYAAVLKETGQETVTILSFMSLDG